MTDSIPIIFIHYGNSDYLKYTLTFAKYYNPDKEIILLGDKKNKHFEKIGIRHYMIEDFSSSPQIKEFHRVFKVVGRDDFEMRGKDNGKSADDKGIFWLKFVFLKMFIMYNFVKQHDIQSFWTFDTDNLVVGSLQELESELSAYDNTELNEGMSMHGLISNIEVLGKYINGINELFLDESYLQTQRNELLKLPRHYSYTEMRAYVECKKRYGFKTYYLSQSNNAYVFDNKFMKSDGMQVRKYDHAVLSQIKNIFIDDEGRFFFQSSTDNHLVRVYSIDCSWLALCVYYILNRYRLKRNSIKGIEEIIFFEPLVFRVKRFIDFYLRKFINHI